MFQYRLTVVDDQPNYIESALRQIEDGITVEGFMPVRRTVRTAEEFQSLCSKKDLAGNVDLFLVDKNLGLGRNQDGANIIRRLRGRVPHIPVLFYSGDSVAVLRKRLNTEKIEGVYCCSRRFLRDECLGMFHAQMASILRPQAVRGMFVGAASELDHSFRRAIELCVNLLQEAGMDLVRAEVIEILAHEIQNANDYLTAVKAGADLNVLLDGRRVTSVHLPAILVKMFEKHFAESRPIGGFLPVLGDYVGEIIQPRNVLAHGKENESGTAIKLGERLIKLDAATTRQHHTALKRHRANVEAIISHLTQISKDAEPPKRRKAKAAAAASGAMPQPGPAEPAKPAAVAPNESH
jgi:CheY-like chemotaxis protein